MGCLGWVEAGSMEMAGGRVSHAKSKYPRTALPLPTSSLEKEWNRRFCRAPAAPLVVPIPHIRRKRTGIVPNHLCPSSLQQAETLQCIRSKAKKMPPKIIIPRCINISNLRTQCRCQE